MMSAAQHNADPQELGAEPACRQRSDAEAWAEVRRAIARMPEAEKEAMRGPMLDLLAELDHGKN